MIVSPPGAIVTLQMDLLLTQKMTKSNSTQLYGLLIQRPTASAILHCKEGA